MIHQFYSKKYLTDIIIYILNIEMKYDEITLETDLFEYLDSIDILYLSMEIGDCFNIVINMDDMRKLFKKYIITVEDIILLLDEKYGVHDDKRIDKIKKIKSKKKII